MARWVTRRRLKRGARGVWVALRRLRPDAFVEWRRPGAFAIAHVGRSGSTVLGSLLAQHPRIQWDGETYGKRFAELDGQFRSTERSAVRLLPHLQREMRSVGPGWFGFDYLLSHLALTNTTPFDHAEDLRRSGFGHFILLRRENQLRRELSSQLARASGTWHSPGTHHHEAIRVDLDVTPDAVHGSVLVNRMRTRREFYEHFRAAHALDRTLELSYEQDLELDPRVGYERVVDFLRLERSAPEIRLQRLNTRPVRDCVGNFDAVVDSLVGTEFEWMLET